MITEQRFEALEARVDSLELAQQNLQLDLKLELAGLRKDLAVTRTQITTALFVIGGVWSTLLALIGLYLSVWKG